MLFTTIKTVEMKMYSYLKKEKKSGCVVCTQAHTVDYYSAIKNNEIFAMRSYMDGPAGYSANCSKSGKINMS